MKVMTTNVEQRLKQWKQWTLALLIFPGVIVVPALLGWLLGNPVGPYVAVFAWGVYVGACGLFLYQRGRESGNR